MQLAEKQELVRLLNLYQADLLMDNDNNIREAAKHSGKKWEGTYKIGVTRSCHCRKAVGRNRQVGKILLRAVKEDTVMNMVCKCGGKEFFTEEHGNQTGLYCSACGKWQKWLKKDEIRLFNHGVKVENASLLERLKARIEKSAIKVSTVKSPHTYMKAVGTRELEKILEEELGNEDMKSNTSAVVTPRLKRPLTLPPTLLVWLLKSSADVSKKRSEVLVRR